MNREGGTGEDLISELDGALMELVSCLGGHDVRMHDGRESVRVLGLLLAAAEILCKHVGMLLMQQRKLRAGLGPQVAGSGG